jgi:predicted short-subunit dehydrogenase-like oxidoreductase (DUF2520 family)
MRKKTYYNFSIIGMGMVGTAIGYLLKNAGHNICAISSRTSVSLKRAFPYTGGSLFRKPEEAVRQADCILISTPDDAIYEVCKRIARPEWIKGKFVFHLSGAGELDLLAPASIAGAHIACIHPLQSFSSIDNAIHNIPGSVFGITANKKIKKMAVNIVHDLQGIPFFISDNQKPLYHIAACFASNYLVSLLNIVEAIYQKIGMDKPNAQKAYLPLVYGTLKNIQVSGVIPALTGPIARGDIGTIKKHLTALDKTIPQYSSLYTSLGLIAKDIAQKKGTLSSQQAKIIRDILKGEIQHEHSKQKQP